MSQQHPIYPEHQGPIRHIRNAPTPPDQARYGCFACYRFSGVHPHVPDEAAEPTSEPPPLVYSVKEAAEELRIGYSTMKEYLRSGEIPSFKLGSRRLVVGEDLADWVRSQVAKGVA